MKKCFSLFLSLILLFGLLPLSSPARAAEIVDSGTCGAQGDNLTWTLDSDGKLTISGTGPMFEYGLGDAPWYSFPANRVKQAVISHGVTNIGRSAFYRCTSLTSVSILSTVTSIGDSAFYDCTSLTNISIPNSVTNICDYAFSGCSSLTGISIPNSVTNIGIYAFHNCTNLTDVSIPVSLTEIGGGIFSGCTSLTSVSIPDNLTKISNRAFDGCTNLVDISIPDSVTSIGYAAFSNCTSLIGVSIPSSVTSIDSSAFSGCTNLTSIFIPDSVTSIDYSAFSGCTSLISVTLSNSLSRINGGCFRDCSSLSSISIPNSVTSIGAYAFSGCKSLSSIIIPNNVTSIDNYAFFGCTSLSNIVLPSNLRRIYDNTFQNCSSLKSIIIPNSVTSIGGHTFDGCSKLFDVTIMGNVSTIKEYSFLNCGALKSVTLPASVSTIETGAFRYCSALTDVYFGGSKEDWDQITIRSYNEPLTSANIHYNSAAPIIVTGITAKTNAAVGETITWTAAANGGTGTLKYYFILYKDGTKIQTRAYSTANTFSYTPAEAGSYKVKVYVMDDADTKVYKTSTGVTVTAAVTISSVKANTTAAKTGQAITWTAAASGGTGTLKYYFILYKDGTKIKTRAYSTANTFSYTPTEAGTYKARVYVKDTADTKVSKLGTAISVTAGSAAPVISSVKADKTAAAAGTKITWTATASGGTGTLQYYFILYKDGTKVKTRAYSTVNTFSYTPLEAGTYKVKVYVKDTVGNKVNKTSAAVTVTLGPPAIISVKAGKTSSAVGEKITWTATAVGSEQPLKYYFILYKDGVKIKTRSYSTTNTFSYTPTEAGAYKVRVYVKDAADAKVNKLSPAVTVS